MKKSELQNLDLLELRNGKKVRFVNGTFISEDLEVLGIDFFDEDLLQAYGDKEEDVVKVRGGNNATLIWERQEIDWSKVPIGTKVYMIPDASKNTPIYYFVKHNKKNKYPFKVLGDDGELHECKYCKLAEEPVTENKLEEKYKEYCDYILETCGGCSKRNCKYFAGSDSKCAFNWLLDNYNVTRKEVK